MSPKKKNASGLRAAMPCKISVRALALDVSAPQCASEEKLRRNLGSAVVLSDTWPLAACDVVLFSLTVPLPASASLALPLEIVGCPRTACATIGLAGFMRLSLAGSMSPRRGPTMRKTRKPTETSVISTDATIDIHRSIVEGSFSLSFSSGKVRITRPMGMSPMTMRA